MITKEEREKHKQIIAAATLPLHIGGRLNPGAPDEYVNIWGPREKPEHQSGPLVAEHVAISNAMCLIGSSNDWPRYITEVERLEAELAKEREAFLLEMGDHRDCCRNFCPWDRHKVTHSCPIGVTNELCNSCAADYYRAQVQEVKSDE